MKMTPEARNSKKARTKECRSESSIPQRRSTTLKAPVIKSRTRNRGLVSNSDENSMDLSQDKGSAEEMPNGRGPAHKETFNSDNSNVPLASNRSSRQAEKSEVIAARYSLDNLLKERNRLSEPQLRVSDLELERILQDSDDSDSNYKVEDCVPLLAYTKEVDAMKRIISEDQNATREPKYSFFHIPKNLPFPEFEDDYSFKVYLSTRILQPRQLTKTDCRLLSQIVLYHSSPEFVADAFLVLTNALRCCPSFQLDLPTFVPDYLKTLGAITETSQNVEGGSLVAELFQDMPNSVQQGNRTYYVAYDNFSNFMSLVLLELELRPTANSPQFLSQLCRWSLLMLMDEQMLVFAFSVQRLFLVCFELLSMQHLHVVGDLLAGLVTALTSHEPNHIKLAMSAQAFLLEAFPVVSRVSNVNHLLQKYRARIALHFLQQSFNPLKPSIRLMLNTDDCIIHTVLGLFKSEAEATHPFKITPKTEYFHLNLQLNFLNFILNPFYFTPALLSTLNTLCSLLKNLHAQIADGGNTKMERSESKDRLQQLYMPLLYYNQKVVGTKSASRASTPRKKKAPE